jgi:hypothetical protein
MNTLTVTRYTFENYFDGYFQEGKFYDKNGTELKEKYYNGRICIQNNYKRFGVVKLRKFAKRTEVLIETLPF